MLIDWFTVGAQILNFIVLVWLLKRFLYKPILTAMDQREKNIADNLKNAAAAKVEAEQERLLFQQKNREFELRKSDMIKAAQTRIEQEHQGLLEMARSQVQQKQKEWEQALSFEQEDFLGQLRTKVQQEVIAITRSVLSELADTELEERMARAFIESLKKASLDTKTEINNFVHKSDHPVVVRSSFNLTEPVKKLIKDTLYQEIAADVTVGFEQSAELFCGIELVANGQKISWTMDKYLSALQQSMEEILEREQAANGSRK